MRKPKKNVKTRNIVLKIETHERLDKYKIKLMNEKEDSKLTFDDVINDLLDEIPQDTRDELKTLGSKGENSGEIIKRLVKVYKERKK